MTTKDQTNVSRRINVLLNESTFDELFVVADFMDTLGVLPHVDICVRCAVRVAISSLSISGAKA